MDVQSNLYLRTNARVSRVIFEGSKAVGVAYVPSRNRADNAEVQETIVCYFLVYIPDIPEAVDRSEPASMSFLALELLEHLRYIQTSDSNVCGLM